MRAMALVCGLVLLCSCATAPISREAKSGSLYQDLGSASGLSRMVDAIVDELHRDARIKTLFENTDDVLFKERLNEQLCELTGGDCEYTGLSMVDAHAGLNLSEGQFNAFVDACRRAMTSIDVPVGQQNRLLALLAPMRGDVIHQ